MSGVFTKKQTKRNERSKYAKHIVKKYKGKRKTKRQLNYLDKHYLKTAKKWKKKRRVKKRFIDEDV